MSSGGVVAEEGIAVTAGAADAVGFVEATTGVVAFEGAGAPGSGEV